MDTVTYIEWSKCVNDMDVYLDNVIIRSENGDDIDVSIRRFIGTEARLAMVRDVADMCFIDGVYYPAMKWVARNINMIIYYTNIDCDVGVDDLYSLICCTDIIELIEHIAYDIPYDAIDEEIKMRNNKTNEMASVVLDVVNGVKDAIEAIGGTELFKSLASDLLDVTDGAKKA